MFFRAFCLGEINGAGAKSMDQGFVFIKGGVVPVCCDKQGLESKGEVLDLIVQ